MLYAKYSKYDNDWLLSQTRSLEIFYVKGRMAQRA
jgi:hypothetical protein